ncbi:hypothetical protein [Planctomyces sp. SH-PL14]|uniref:hypothetical protein n=1 Tax=Planctomyces sp. SH-PL14 TaxID=1632864 RepID=UPI00078E1B10|nr:hypothetical protein [Planctomyces sp. SH-PL14]AMV21038.1 hypothetical protein VT03_24255 [Planctomyces sp. SH-PL14]
MLPLEAPSSPPLESAPVPSGGPPGEHTDASGPTPLDRRLAPVMFGLTTLFTLTLGILLHLPAGQADEPYAIGIWICVAILAGAAGLLLLEALGHSVAGTPRWGRDLVCVLFPPARLVGRDHAGGRHVWLPGLGWRVADDELAEEVERRLGLPMIGVALLVLPLLGVEMMFLDKQEQLRGWELALRLCSAFIWTLFTMEFLVMITIVTRKLQYVKQHWLDLAIILLPLVEFLRALRIGRLLRLHQLTKLSRTARVFRMRGMLMRTWRALLLLGVVRRLLKGSTAKQIAALQERIRTAEEELAEMRTELAQLEAEAASLPARLS